jgi:hypothetical protein
VKVDSPAEARSKNEQARILADTGLPAVNGTAG